MEYLWVEGQIGEKTGRREVYFQGLFKKLSQRPHSWPFRRGAGGRAQSPDGFTS